MTANQFIAALQAGVNAVASAAAITPTVAGTAAPQLSATANPVPAPATANQAAAVGIAKTPDLITKFFSWLIPAGWTPAKLI
jgi:hypothetical protein